jgi:malate dehydrogenase (oxaloacetate-decarboxylating)
MGDWAPFRSLADAIRSLSREVGAIPAEFRSLSRDQRNTFLACFLGWMLDAFDFFLVVLVVTNLAHDFGFVSASRSGPPVINTLPIFLAITLTLAMRPVGALLFGSLADRFGRRRPLMANIAFYSLIEGLTAFSPNYAVFLVLRMLFGVGMGGEWGMGAALAMESLPARSRGLFSGLLQQGYACGYLLAATAAALVLPHFSWRVLFLAGALPALLVLFIRARIPESPAWRDGQAGRRTTARGMLEAARQHWRLFIYVVLLMTAFNFMAHSSQDVYPTFLRDQVRVPSIGIRSAIIILYNVGAICGGILFGLYSERLGRRRAIVIAAALALLLVPLWAGLFSFAAVALAIGAFLMQFMVQGAWGVIPAHLNELSPPAVRSTFPGVAYQLGNLLAAVAPTLVGALALSHRAPGGSPNYSLAQAGVLAGALLAVIAITAFGHENLGRNLGTTKEVVSRATREGLMEDRTVKVTLRGRRLLEEPFFNKGSAFTDAERRELGLLGLLPYHEASTEAQLAHCYENYRHYESALDRYIFLSHLQDHNEMLFFRLVLDHIEEMAPIIYTPTVGTACQSYSHLYRRPRGLYIALLHQDDIETILRNGPSADPRVIVVTDGERILGLGDLGIGGMGIPVGKLALYTLCAGIHPAATLPIVLDVGTENPDLLADPLYLGLRRKRARGEEYADFIEAFVQGVRRIFPRALLQWEDFGKDNARPLLERYQHQICTFNDDIQGTGAVTLAGLLAAVDALGAALSAQRVIVLGAGSASTGICEQIVAAMQAEGSSAAEALSTIWLVDSQGLVHGGRGNLEPAKGMFAQPVERIADWAGADERNILLEEVVRQVRPTVLIGTAAQEGAFTEAIVREMARHSERPIILPLSNPTSKCEATPEDLLAWTDGKALVATGSPFEPVVRDGRAIAIGQCNNAFIFPGLGLGVIASGARRVTPGMFLAAARALSELAPIRTDSSGPLFPPMRGDVVRAVSLSVALAVGAAAQEEGMAKRTTKADLERRVAKEMWDPHYPTLKRRW